MQRRPYGYVCPNCKALIGKEEPEGIAFAAQCAPDGVGALLLCPHCGHNLGFTLPTPA